MELQRIIEDNFSPDFVKRIVGELNRKTDDVIQSIKREPYEAGRHLSIRFKEMDKLYLLLNPGNEKHPVRLRAAYDKSQEDAKRDGHTMHLRNAVGMMAALLIDGDMDSILQAIDGTMAPEIPGGENFTMHPGDSRAERVIAEFVEKRTALSSDGYEHDGMPEGLADDQQEGFKMFFDNPKLFILTGGPGTGKTHLLRSILDSYEKSRETFSIVLCSPTGKAAQRMHEMTGRPAGTIHATLGAKMVHGRWQWTRHENNPIEADLVVVDETSMLDSSLARRLFEAIPDTADVLLVGDHKQLPPVMAGAPFRDMLFRVPTCELREVKRQSPGGIVEVCHDMIRGKPLDYDKLNKDDLFWSGKVVDAEIRDEVIDLYFNRLPAKGKKEGWYRDQRDITILSPYKKDEILLSSTCLNKVIQAERLSRGETSNSGFEFNIGDRVIQTKNDAKSAVMNGDLGFIKDAYHSRGKACYKIEMDSGVSFTTNGRDRQGRQSLSLGYAMTIHKSQGSEWPGVILPVFAKASFFYSKAMFYTAISRGSKAVVLVGPKGCLDKAISNEKDTSRITSLPDRLKAMGLQV